MSLTDMSYTLPPELPSFDGCRDSEEKIERVLDYLYQLNERYQYVLCQLQSGDE